MRFKDFDLIDICFRAAILTERERTELNDQGIRILKRRKRNSRGEWRRLSSYRGESYNKLRKVLKFRINNLIFGYHGQ